jgi:ABC-2 type transport system permease protein
MVLSRIFAILRQEIYITRHSFEVIVDLGLFPLINFIVFGFVSLWLAGPEHKVNAYYLLVGTILWNIVYINQYSIAVGSLWNIWSHNLSNMFVAPLTIKEYIIAIMLSGILKTTVVFIFTSSIAVFIFHYSIFSLGIINLFIYFLNLTLFAWTLGLIVLGLIFRFGTRIQALAWSIAYLAQPLTAAFYPVTILPPFLRTISYLLPATYVFEGARKNVFNQSVQWESVEKALILNAIYLVVAVLLFKILLKQSKESGQFARNDG